MAANVVGGGLAAIIMGVAAATGKMAGTPNHLLETSFYAVMGIVTFVSVLALVALFFVAKRFTKRPFAHFLTAVSLGSCLKAALTGITFLLVCSAIAAALQYGFHISVHASKIEQAMMPTTSEQFAVAVACGVIIVPLYEGVLFRGFVFGWLKRIGPMWLAMVISAGLFTLAHGFFAIRGGVSGWLGTGEIFVLGCLMAWWVARTNSLWPSYTDHISTTYWPSASPSWRRTCRKNGFIRTVRTT